MSNLSDALEKLQDTHAMMTRVSKELARDPEDFALNLTMRSLEARERKLAHDFQELAYADFQDICVYRMIDEAKRRFPVVAVADVLKEFQGLVTLVFDAIRTGPKKQARYSIEAEALSTFHFGYASPGSLAIVLTVQNERLLLEKSDLDKAVETVFAIAKCDTPAALREYAKEVGIGVIRKTFAWVDRHTTHQLSVDVQWKRREEGRGSLLMQTSDFEQLKAIIAATSDYNEEIVDVDVANLVGLDTDKKTFHLKYGDAEDISGKWADTAVISESLPVPGLYPARLLKKTRVHYSYDQEAVAYELLTIAQKGPKQTSKIA